MELQNSLQGMISPFGRSLVAGSPELAIVFVHRLLRPDEVSRLSNAYQVNTGGALSELKVFYGATSVVLMNARLHTPRQIPKHTTRTTLHRRMVSGFRHFCAKSLPAQLLSLVEPPLLRLTVC